MPESITATRGDSRTEELVARNEKELQFIPEESIEFAQRNLIHVFNVSPYEKIIEHPSFGRLLIPACEKGKEYSEPLIVEGLVFTGVCVEMKTVEMRHESGRVCVIDLLGLGPFKNKANCLLNWGIFIAAEDTFDPAKNAEVRVATGRNGKAIKMHLPDWVKKGKLGVKPTRKEIATANALFEQTDMALIAEGDDFAAQGQEGQKNISKMHREALLRRGQTRGWSDPVKGMTLIACPGCQENIKPGVVVHTCGSVLDWDKAIALGIKKAEDRPKKNG
jgi:hypothetical protein